LAIDVIILATGYSVDFTFLNSVQDLKDENLVDQKLEKSPKIYPFYKNTFTPYIEKPETLIFVGFAHNLLHICELQSRWAVGILRGQADSLPRRRELMISEIEKDETIKKRKFGGAREDELWAWIMDINPISL